MATYGRVMSSIWTDPDFIALKPQVQQVYLLLLSSSSRDHAGVLPLTLRRWAKCSAGATTASIEAALNALADANFVVVDWDTEEVLVRTYIRNDGVWKQPQVMRAALRSAADVQSYRLRNAVAAELNSLPGFDLEPVWQEFAKLLEETPNAACAQGSGSLPAGSGVGEGEGEGVKPKRVVKISEPKRGTRLPEGWMPQQSTIDTIKAEFPNAGSADIRREHNAFADWAASCTTKAAVKCNWDAAWRNWMRRELAKYTNGPPHTGLVGADKKAMDWMELAERMDSTNNGKEIEA